MPFGEKSIGHGSPLAPVRIELPPSPDNLSSRDTGLPEMFRRPRRQKYVYYIGQANNPVTFVNWNPATAICWNYTNQWLFDEHAAIYIPPTFVMSYPIPDGTGGISITTTAPSGTSQNTPTDNQPAVFWFFENDLMATASLL